MTTAPHKNTFLATSASERWFITLAVMLVAVVEVLDMTIVTVSLPAMMGSLGASQDQITWVLTSYIVSAAVCMPLTGLLVKRMGRKRLLMVNIVGFMIASALCGTATTLTTIILYRTLQGIFGAALVPLAQFILRDTFPQEELGKAMAIWGIGIMVGPVFGPTLGGYITEHLNWRWVFYINVPVCIIAMMMAMRYVKETPRVNQFIDWCGLILMAVGVGALQILLDRGNEEGWFQSNSIMLLALISFFALSLFILRGWGRKDNIIDLKLFIDRNFAITSLLLLVFCMGLMGVISLQPLLMEHLLGYPVQTAGEAMAPRGIASAFAMMLTPVLMKRYDFRHVMAAGLLSVGIGTYFMTGYTLDMAKFNLIWPTILQGIGMGLFFVPLSTVAFVTLKPEQVAEASGLFSFNRSLGTSIGISISSTIISNLSQVNWHRLGSHLTPYNSQAQQWFHTQGLDSHNPAAIQRLAEMVNQHATLIAFIDSYWAVTLAILATIPLVYLLKKPQGSIDPSIAAH